MSLDAHAAVDRLAHVVDGERRHRDRGQRLHLDPGPAGDPAGGADPDAAVLGLRRQLDRDRGQRQRMAEGIRSAVRLAPMIPASCATPSTSPFLKPRAVDPRQGLGRHRDPPLGRGGALGDVLAADVDHDRVAGGVEVGEAASCRDAPAGGGWRAVTSGSRIRLSPTRNARAPAAAMRSEVGMAYRARSRRPAGGPRGATRREAARTMARSTARVFRLRLLMPISVRRERAAPARARPRRAPRPARPCRARPRSAASSARLGVVEAGHDQQHAVGAQRPRFDDLPRDRA